MLSHLMQGTLFTLIDFSIDMGIYTSYFPAYFGKNSALNLYTFSGLRYNLYLLSSSSFFSGMFSSSD